MRPRKYSEKGVATSIMYVQAQPWHRWLYLLGFSPVLLAIWYVNGVFSVQGLPFVISLVTQMSATEFSPAIIEIVRYLGWFFVVATSVLEINLFSRGLPNNASWASVTPERWTLSGIAVVYDYLSTAGGVYFWLAVTLKLGGGVLVVVMAIVLAVVLTPAFEIIVSAIRRLK